MTEDVARALLRAFDSFDKLEAWIADQPWQAAPGGWTVTTELRGWRFRLERVPGGLQVSSCAPSLRQNLVAPRGWECGTVSPARGGGPRQFGRLPF